MDLTNVVEAAEARWAAEVDAIYELVMAGTGSIFMEAGFLPVGETIAATILEETGLNVFGHEHILDTFSVRHIVKHHGTNAEYKRGQAPVTKEDFLQLPQLLLAPDTIEYTGKTKQGRDVLCYSKVIWQHTVFYTEEIRTKKSRLATVTLYKRKTKNIG